MMDTFGVVPFGPPVFRNSNTTSNKFLPNRYDNTVYASRPVQSRGSSPPVRNGDGSLHRNYRSVEETEKPAPLAVSWNSADWAQTLTQESYRTHEPPSRLPPWASSDRGVQFSVSGGGSERTGPSREVVFGDQNSSTRRVAMSTYNKGDYVLFSTHNNHAKPPGVGKSIQSHDSAAVSMSTQRANVQPVPEPVHRRFFNSRGPPAETKSGDRFRAVMKMDDETRCNRENGYSGGPSRQRVHDMPSEMNVSDGPMSLSPTDVDRRHGDRQRLREKMKMAQKQGQLVTKKGVGGNTRSKRSNMSQKLRSSDSTFDMERGISSSSSASDGDAETSVESSPQRPARQDYVRQHGQWAHVESGSFQTAVLSGSSSGAMDGEERDVDLSDSDAGRTDFANGAISDIGDLNCRISRSPRFRRSKRAAKSAAGHRPSKRTTTRRSDFTDGLLKSSSDSSGGSDLDGPTEPTQSAGYRMTYDRQPSVSRVARRALSKASCGDSKKALRLDNCSSNDIPMERDTYNCSSNDIPMERDTYYKMALDFCRGAVTSWVRTLGIPEDKFLSDLGCRSASQVANDANAPGVLPSITLPAESQNARFRLPNMSIDFRGVASDDPAPPYILPAGPISVKFSSGVDGIVSCTPVQPHVPPSNSSAPPPALGATTVSSTANLITSNTTVDTSTSTNHTTTSCAQTPSDSGESSPPSRADFDSSANSGTSSRKSRAGCLSNVSERDILKQLRCDIVSDDDVEEGQISDTGMGWKRRMSGERISSGSSGSVTPTTPTQTKLQTTLQSTTAAVADAINGINLVPSSTQPIVELDLTERDLFSQSEGAKQNNGIQNVSPKETKNVNGEEMQIGQLDVPLGNGPPDGTSTKEKQNVVSSEENKEVSGAGSNSVPHSQSVAESEVSGASLALGTPKSDVSGTFQEPLESTETSSMPSGEVGGAVHDIDDSVRGDLNVASRDESVRGSTSSLPQSP
eukprot:Lankesteria_metandrocarpae@DN4695_c0_g1_i1.p1